MTPTNLTPPLPVSTLLEWSLQLSLERIELWDSVDLATKYVEDLVEELDDFVVALQTGEIEAFEEWELLILTLLGSKAIGNEMIKQFVNDQLNMACLWASGGRYMAYDRETVPMAREEVERNESSVARATKKLERLPTKAEEWAQLVEEALRLPPEPVLDTTPVPAATTPAAIQIPPIQRPVAHTTPQSRIVEDDPVLQDFEDYQDPEETNPTHSTSLIQRKVQLSDIYHLLIDKDVINRSMQEQLGSGKYGWVRKVKLNGRFVAEKVLKQHTREDFFVQEVWWTSQFRHPYILNFLGCYFTESHQDRYIYLELMSKVNMETFISKPTFSLVPLNLRLRWALQVTDAIAYMNDRHLVHRDISCKNILLSSNHVAKLSDFTFVRNVKETDSGQKQSMGTHRYMSPEMATNNCNDDMASDIWALGLLIVTILTGIPPHRKVESKEALVNLLTLIYEDNFGKADSSKTSWEDVRLNDASIFDLDPHARQLKNALPRCWRYDPSARASAREFVRILEKWDAHLHQTPNKGGDGLKLQPFREGAFTFPPVSLDRATAPPAPTSRRSRTMNKPLA